MDIKEEIGRDELKRIDVKNLRWWGISPLSWDWSRGAKTVRYYSVGGTDQVQDRRVKVEWAYVMDSNNRNVTNHSRMIYFLENDGLTSFMSQDISKVDNSVSLGELNQDIRKRRITDLTENASQLPGGEDLVNYLYEWYGSEIDTYIGPHGGTELKLEDALKGENDAFRLAVLTNPISALGTPFHGVQPMQLLIYQLIGAYSWT